MKTIKLAHGVVTDFDRPSTKSYKVVSVKNSTDYNPGDILDKKAVDTLCFSNKWDVTIVSLQTA